VIDFYRHYWGTWDDYVLEAAECIDAGADEVVMVHHERGSGRGSGTPFERRWAVIWTLREGKLTRVRTFNTREDALDVARAGYGRYSRSPAASSAATRDDGAARAPTMVR
jgi:hypothetical protein